MPRRRSASELSPITGDEILTLTMADGSTTTMPWREREVTDGKEGEGRRRKIRWPDFTVLADPETGAYLRCERCEGYPAIGGAEMNAGAPRGGVVTIVVKRQGQRRGEADRIVRVAAACGCAYGAWVHRCQDLPFAGDLGAPNCESMGYELPF